MDDNKIGKKPGRVKKGAGANTGSEKPGGRRFEIDVFRDWCKSCGICAAFCPRECIELDDDGIPRVDSKRCTGCGWCELHCPDFAISVHHKDGEHPKEKNQAQNDT